jgi:uncharacterized protein
VEQQEVTRHLSSRLVGPHPHSLALGRFAPRAGRRRCSPIVVALLALLILLAPSARSEAADPPLPELTQPVNDFAHVIDAASAAAIDRDIRALKAATGDVVVVATIDTFAPYGDLREYAVKMFENQGRGIGDKGKDNGLLVLLAVKDRKVWAEVGYDLEQFVTDGYAGEVSRTYMAPAFARGEYGAGLLAGMRQLIGRIAQGRGVTISGVPPPAASDGGSGLPISPRLLIMLIMAMIVFSRLARSRMMGSRGRWGTGPWSGWNSGIGPFGGGGGFGGGGFGGGFGGFGGGRSGGGGGGAGW